MNSQSDFPTDATRSSNKPVSDAAMKHAVDGTSRRAATAAAEFDPDVVMQRVRAEVARRRTLMGIADGPHEDSGLAAGAGSALRWQPAAARLPDKGQYVLADFLGFDDQDFVDVVYRKLLRRSANDEGSRSYLAALRSGAVGKVEVVGSIRFSDEGRRHGVHVDGLLVPYRLHRWRRKRIVGWLLGMGMAVLRLPRLARRIERVEATAARESQEMGRLLNRGLAELQSHTDDLSRFAAMQQTHLEEQGAQLEAQDAQLAALQGRIDEQRASMAELREWVDGDQRRLRSMLERLTVFLDVSSRSASGGEVGQEPESERQYAAFEDAFRGERSLIKRRVAHYLGTLAAAGIAPGDTGTILDLGSGRGEWLEVLAEQGYRGRGVDLNRGMLRASQERGHDVVEANAIDYLRTQDDDAFAAVTAMHLVEHIPHDALLELLDQALRILRPGGVLILETPNPENVRVGSYTFYMDPTHRNPIPPLLLQWAVQARGFENASIERLTDHRGLPELVPVSDDVAGAEQINQMIAWFTAPSDYAVIACKPAAPPRPA